MSRALRILFVTNGIFVFASSLLGPLYAVFVGTFDNKILSVSISWFTYLSSTLLFTYYISKVGDRIKETEYLLIIGFLLRGLAWMLFIYTNSLALLVIVQVLLGLGEAIGSPAFDSILARHLVSGEQIRDYSDWKIVSNIAGALGVLVGGLIVTEIGFNALFLMMSSVSLFVSVYLMLQPRRLL